MHYISVLLLTAALLCGCATQEAADPQLLEAVVLEPETAVVSYEDMFNLTAVEGCILPASVPVAFPMDGIIAEVNVVPGQSVKKGDLLATMDMESTLERIEELGTQMEEEATKAERSISSLRMTAEIHRAELASLNAAGDSYAAAVKEVDLWEALMEVRHAEANQQAAHDRLQQQIEELQSLVEECGELRAPTDGVVSWLMDGILKDKYVVEDEILLCISDMSQLYVVADRVTESVLESSDRIYAKIGQEEYELIPRENSMEEDMTDTDNGIALTSKFDFKTQPDPGVLTQGGNGLVVCRWRYLPDALCVPRGAIFREAQENYVYVIEEGVMVRTPVEVGIGTALRTQILSGLEEGQVVYVAE